MKKPLFIYLLSLAAFAATGQSAANPLYWKNRPPHPGYWQQDVHYFIKANIDEKMNIISGEEKLVYRNNSPDTLHRVYFHLYQNAFQPGSYYDNLWRNNKQKPVFGRYEQKGLGTVIESVGVSHLSDSAYAPEGELDNTLLMLRLKEPLLPGDSVTFHLAFKTHFDNGSMRRRMKMFRAYGYTHFDGVHWYPRISVYDRKFGWTTDQDLDKEYYGDYGTYDVELTFANNYIVEATGELLNKEEVLPDSLRKKLDIKNFADKPLEEAPSVIIPYDTSVRKTWRYHAENVHDFAFTADPAYRIGEAVYLPEGRPDRMVRCIALVQEPHASRWQNAAEFASKVIQVYSEDFGPYEYPKIIVADARDGMEYPMLTLDAGLDPDYRGLLAHEIGHMWFYGMVGNNETYRAAMDEGFTQFLTAWALEKIDGKYIVSLPYASWYLRKFMKPSESRDTRVYLSYLQDAMRQEDRALNTHSSDFDNAIRQGGGYRSVYHKTAAMLFNLQYVLGDSLFNATMKHYVSQWKFCHPYFEDFRNSIITFTHADLNWFFDQWMETTKRIDYEVGAVTQGTGKDEYIIRFRRKEQMQMPLDFEVTAKDGKKYGYHIPNTWFVKETQDTVLEKWYGWGTKLNPVYKAEVTIPGGIRNVQIDPSGRLADIYPLDNSKKCPVRFRFDAEVSGQPDRRHYEMRWRPDMWYNSYDGIKAGLHLDGHYMNIKHVFSLSAWYNTGALQGGVSMEDFGSVSGGYDPVSFAFSYTNLLDRVSQGLQFSTAARWLDGLYLARAGMEKELDNGSRVYASVRSMIRNTPESLNYLLYPGEWGVNRYNNTQQIGFAHPYRYWYGSGLVGLQLTSPSLLSDYDYSALSLSCTNKNRIGKLRLNTRLYARYGTGVPADESALYLAGAGPEEMMESKFTRAAGIVPDEWAGYGIETNHFHAGGGLNLRGYSGYVIGQEDRDGFVRYAYKGNSGASVNAELEFGGLLRFRPKLSRNTFRLEPYLFGDAGSISYNPPGEAISVSDIRTDAGIGFALTVKRFWVLYDLEPLTLRFDFPLFLNRPPASEEYFQFRWVVGVNRAF